MITYHLARFVNDDDRKVVSIQHRKAAARARHANNGDGPQRFASVFDPAHVKKSVRTVQLYNYTKTKKHDNNKQKHEVKERKKYSVMHRLIFTFVSLKEGRNLFY